jgi:hypothetical protein
MHEKLVPVNDQDDQLHFKISSYEDEEIKIIDWYNRFGNIAVSLFSFCHAVTQF